jgi:hypothetical protein
MAEEEPLRPAAGPAGILLKNFPEQRSELTNGYRDGLRRSMDNWRSGVLIDLGAIKKILSGWLAAQSQRHIFSCGGPGCA